MSRLIDDARKRRMTDFDKDIIEALRYQVMTQNEELQKYRLFIRSLKKTPHDWLQEEIREVLGEPSSK